MLADSFVRIKVAAATLVAAMAVAATPGYANSAASTDVAAPLRAAQAGAISSSAGDEQFRKLFNNWQSLEQTSVPALAAVGDAAPIGRTGSVASAAPGQVRLISGVRVGGSLPMGTFPGQDDRQSMPFRTLTSPVRPAIPSRSPMTSYRLTSAFGMREHPILGGVRLHAGVDLAAPIGTPVYATADGVVEKAQTFGGYGLFVAIDHGGNLETRYGHMSRLAVATGEHVHKGEVIGYVGVTGRTTGPHLHYEVRLAGQPVNPMTYMPATDAVHGEITGSALDAD